MTTPSGSSHVGSLVASAMLKGGEPLRQLLTLALNLYYDTPDEECETCCELLDAWHDTYDLGLGMSPAGYTEQYNEHIGGK